ncbi:nitrous oxide reductase accessory protein NosL [Aureibaculum sp. 2210JD6-5]|uniref:nitrous oxide reductase accessory protein NosL n=1 Tax=Aureibaculum sp. 2210JD6-5 TaxID=3103957 RepID=UPI002AADEAAE|nr:nitrous oxide reductase accessory protein NosL [Aureibaculum sp. 2210JD6-5]MDY7396683.1 nitrous oxide reductase accessory protein NosL [Aureibaculum sp. 2210JD6-5]
MKNLYLILSLALLLVSCSIEPSKIEYGKDACHYCTMTIVEKKHAAQIVTKKGKPFKYDAIECMLNDLKERESNEIGLFLVTDYLTPTTLFDAKTATYLISPTIQSPMGANLSAFATKDQAQKFVKSEADKTFNWQEIQQENFK